LAWDWLSPQPQNHPLNAVIYAGGQFVAAGEGGTVLTSPDGQTWAWHPAGVDVPLQALDYGLGQYIAVGGAIAGDGAIITSPDGVTWTRQARVKNVVLTSIACSFRRCVAAGTEFGPDGVTGVVLTSDDGTDWRRSTAEVPTYPGDLVYGSGLFAMLSGQAVQVSPDGQAWSARPLPAKGNADGDGTWGQRLITTGVEFAVIATQVVGGERSNPMLLTSPDAKAWTAHPAVAPGELYALAWDGNRYVATGSGATVLTSPDGGETWSTYYGSWTAMVKALACKTGRCVGAGGGGGYSEGPTLISTQDLKQWTVTGGDEPIAYSLAYGNGQFIAVRGGLKPVTHTSPDGLTWTRADGGWGPLLSITFQGGRFLAGSTSGNAKYLVTSADGRTWEHGPEFSIWAVSGITYGKGRYVVGTAGGGIGVFSSDLQSNLGGSMGSLLDAAYGKGVFVGAGLVQLSDSTDGLTWTTAVSKPVDETRRANAGDTFRAVAYGAGHFVAVGGSAVGFLLTSPNGRDWDQVPTDTSGLLGVIYGGGRFLAWSAGTILTSADGETWTAQPNRAGAATFAYGAGRFIAVGPGGTLMATTVCGARFSDVGRDHPDCDAVEDLARRAIASGDPDGAFRPADPVTRAEAAKWLVLALGLRPDPPGPLPFSDAAGHWAARDGYLQAAAAGGLVSGFPDGAFRPDQPVTRAELAKMAAAAAGLKPAPGPAYSDISGGDWFAGWVAAGRAADLVGPGGYYPLWAEAHFGGDAPATRGEAARLLGNLANH
jgi:hypothetical protein